MSLLVADARLLDPGQYESLIVFGSTAIGDGGGGIYVWDSAASNADDGEGWLKPSATDAGDPGRWRRVDVLHSTAAAGGSTTAALTDAATVAIDLADADNFTLTINGNRLMGNPSGQVADRGGVFFITQGAAGGHSLAWDTNFYFSGSVPVMPSTAGARLDVPYHVLADGVILCGGAAPFGTGAGTVAEGNHNHDSTYQPIDAELLALAGLTSSADTLPYFSDSGTAATTTLTSFGRSLIDDTDNAEARTTLGLGTIATQAASNVTITGGSVTGITDIAIADGGTGASTAAAAFSNLKQAATTTATGVVELATDGETAANVVVQGNDSRLVLVTLAGTPDYLTISNQQITRALINLATHVTGTLPYTSVGNRSAQTNSGTTRTNTAADRGNWVRWTASPSAKTFTIANSVASAGDVWSGINAGTGGNLTLVAGSGVTLTGNLVFAPGRSYTVYFTSASAADVIGGTAT